MNPFAIMAEALDRLEIPFVVGGSLASSAHGEMRTTLDVDLVVRITPDKLVELAETLGTNWIVDVDYGRAAIRDGRSFNVLYLKPILKFDFFPATTTFQQEEIGRAVNARILIEGEWLEAPVTSAEDIVIAKLLWYRSSDEPSERQWRDIAMVLTTCKSLDGDYLARWAKHFKLEELLKKALADSQR